MTGAEWRKRLSRSEGVRGGIPLELSATLPLPLEGRRAVCWYYAVTMKGDGIELKTPALRAVFDADTFELIEKRALDAVPAGAGGDLVTEAYARAQDDYLSGAFSRWLSGGKTDMAGLRAQWLAAAPAAIRETLFDMMKEV